MGENVRTMAIGVAYASCGLYDGTGVMAKDMALIDRIAADTIQFEFKEKTATNFNEEYSDDPYYTMYLKKDPDGFQFAIPSPTAEERKRFCGGTIDENGEWAEPTVVPEINHSFLIRTKPYKGKQVQYRFVNCAVSAYISQAPGKEKEEWLLVKVTKQSVKDVSGKKLSGFFVKYIDAVDDVEGTIEVTDVAITGTAKVGVVLTAKPTPADAMGTYQWQKKSGSSAATDISGATGVTYTPVVGDVGAKILVKFTGSGEYSGSVTSTETVAVVAAT